MLELVVWLAKKKQPHMEVYCDEISLCGNS